MIVKNESKVIERCLSSLKGFIDYWVIVDTGSSDGTQEIIKKFMKDVPGELHERPWVDFAFNRNEAMRLAQNRGDYLLFIDADEQLRFSKDFHKPDLDKDCYFIACENSGTKYIRCHLINPQLHWEWEGIVHETLQFYEGRPCTGALLDGVSNMISMDGCRSQDPKKYKKDAELLEKAVAIDPTNKRNVFYLAKSYQDCGEYANALKYFQMRASLGSFDEEVHWSLCQIALLQEALNWNQETVTNSYCKAFLSCPSRAEPLYHLARYYNAKKMPVMGYLISKFALTIPEPKVAMFVESWIYDFGLLVEFSTGAFLSAKYDDAYQACVKLLDKPNLPAEIRKLVVNNLSCFKPLNHP